MNYEQYILAEPHRRVPANHVLAKSGIDFYSDSFVAHASRPLQKDFLRFEFDDAENTGVGGVLVVTARESTDEGRIGIYEGVNRWTFAKIPIANTLPYPIRYASDYPTNWGYMRDWFHRVYNLYFEENDLCINGTTPLQDNDPINLDLVSPRDYLIFRCSSLSRRFAVDGIFRVVLTPPAKTPLSLSGFANGLMESSVGELLRRPLGGL